MQTMRRGLDILEFVLSEARPVGCTDVAVRYNFSASTASRLLNDLADYGYLHRTQNHQYVAGMRILQLARQQLETMALVQCAVPYLSQLVERTRGAVYLGVLWRGVVVELHRVWWHQPAATSSDWEPQKAPLYASAMGKLLLAHMDQHSREKTIRHLRFQQFTPNTIHRADALRAELNRIVDAGHAVNRGEASDAWSVAAPVRDGHDKVAAAVGASAQGWADLRRLDYLLAATKEAAFEISQALGQVPAWKQHKPS